MNVLHTPTPPSRDLPDHTQLPDKDNIPVNNSQEPMLSRLLTGSLKPILERLHPDNDYFIGEDVGIYWRLVEPRLRGAKSPDWYYVPGVPYLLDGLLRRSYVMWQEHIHPYVILEYVSGNGAEERDNTPNEGKYWVYENVIRPQFYGIYEIDHARLEMHQLVNDRFEVMTPNADGRYALPALEVEIGIWHGEYESADVPWLRWWNPSGKLVPTMYEAAESESLRANEEKRRANQEMRRANSEKQRANKEKQRADMLAEKLRSLGIDPNDVS